MLILCDNKNCHKSSNALLNPETLEVICQECGKPIENVSDAMKRTLKSFGQIIRVSKKAFMLACPQCKANREVVLDQDNNTICKNCHSPLKIHPAFKIAMEEAGGLDKVEVDKTPKKKKKVTRKKKV